jgi:RHS repeat-associated protein
VSDYTFTGQRAERGLGLMDYQARYYDSYLNRFISADTIVAEPGNPQSLNRYSYVNNSPLRFNDPTGHSRPLPPCSICQVKIDTSNWSDLVKGLAVPVGFLTGLHADQEQNLVTGPTEQEWMESSLTNMVTPMGMVSGPAERAIGRLSKEEAVEFVERTGRWIQRNEAMSKAARAYQRFISGRSDDLVLKLGNYTFDSFDLERGVLQDAKAIPTSFINPETGKFNSWVTGTEKWLKQAADQIESAGRVPIEWSFDSQEARDAMYHLFQEQNPALLDSVELIYKPKP